MDYIIKQLYIEDIQSDLLKYFNRYQEVNRCWRKADSQWILKEIAFVEQWDEALKQEIVREDLIKCLENGGAVWGVFGEESRVIGFASLLAKPIGSRGQYRKLMQIHISYEHRNMGIGKKLFGVCAQKAKEMGAEKLYISAHSSEESQLFYSKMGCVDALEIDQFSVEQEPCDRQLEYVL